jgi:ABC-type sugar transport system permease subunit
MVGAITTNFNIPRAATYAMIMLLSILIITLPMLRLARRGLNEEG